ncbi:MAG TPA: pyridoxine 5'-phosphate synthase [Ignavibacteriales bacterium]|nr:pyridoxine 5'-phosphate synthase [Ignavibacteriales bacterium]HOL81053.1 pyridoxine 5'-phosphate synthase [Ignavibacteriales bacterium]HOM64788.1 pyridoxine 5'-phosphate synthase [Ignavibacteriales bacterium]HPD68132.1 pyridoxine 5'-phosphate synthase [Ignavibacteriales bacterium]HPP32833.1 pyridoxine 5'-phosphate synthase [Ignavibacteriales bacterium]
MKLSVNIDHIATLRNARREMQPDPVQAAVLSELAGADGIVVHLREDRRHIHERDVFLLREIITTKLDLEMAAVEEIIKIACDVKPDLVTLVPEKREELTTEGGLNIIDNIELLTNSIKELHNNGIPVSLFIEPDNSQIEASLDVGADFIEIHTGKFANLKSYDEKMEELERIRLAAKYAKKYGLGVNAGHGLNYENIKIFRELDMIDEVSIGHAIIARAVLVGIEKAVKEMINLIKFG